MSFIEVKVQEKIEFKVGDEFCFGNIVFKYQKIQIQRGKFEANLHTQ